MRADFAYKFQDENSASGIAPRKRTLCLLPVVAVYDRRWLQSPENTVSMEKCDGHRPPLQELGQNA
jgi:hypothetical protein